MSNIVAKSFIAVGALCAVMSWATSVAAEDTPDTDDGPATFTPEFLHDPHNIALGKEVWDEQCTHCHGSKAYPGKAPKLRPSKYKPDFVYRRVTKGFRGMPPWEDVYDQEHRMAVVAYVLSKDFAP